MINKREISEKAWQEAWITEDVIFGRAFENPKNCTKLLRAVLPNLNIRSTQPFIQRNIKENVQDKGIRLDVLAVDDRGRRYDIEMQTTDSNSLGNRLRYYQSKMDTHSLYSGENYKQLAQTYVIFFFPFDPFNDGRVRYTFKLRCEENYSIKLNTNSHLILLNSTGTKGKVSSDLKSFFALMNRIQ